MDAAGVSKEPNPVGEAGALLQLESARAWFTDLATRWREQLATASETVAEGLTGSLDDLRPPARLDVFILHGSDPQVHATLVIVRRATPDLQIRPRLFRKQHVERL